MTAKEERTQIADTVLGVIQETVWGSGTKTEINKRLKRAHVFFLVQETITSEVANVWTIQLQVWHRWLLGDEVPFTNLSAYQLFWFIGKLWVNGLLITVTFHRWVYLTVTELDLNLKSQTHLNEPDDQRIDRHVNLR